MNWSLIILCIVALSTVTYAENSYLVIVPNLFKVGYDNQISVFIGNSPQPVEIQLSLTIGEKHIENKTICKSGETQNVTLTLPNEFPMGPGQLTIIGSGGLHFEETREIIIYDNHHVILVQTSASTYRPHDTMEIRVVVTDENFIPMENAELTIEIYDAGLKLVGEFHHVPVHSGLSETIKYPIAEHVNVGVWLVSATIENTTSSVEVLVAYPIKPSFGLKAIFQRFILRTDKYLLGTLHITNDNNQPIFGRGLIAVGQITADNPKRSYDDQWKQWKSQKFEIAGEFDIGYELLSSFKVDISKCIAIEIYIQVTELSSAEERVIRHIIPVFTRDIIYDIRPLQFQTGVTNEFEIISKRPDGKPVEMEDMIINVQMILENEQGKHYSEKSIEIKDFYQRGRNDIGFFNVEIPENCLGILMTIMPKDKTGKVHDHRIDALPLLPTPHSHNAKLSIELLPFISAPKNTGEQVPIVRSQVPTIGHKSNFSIQLIPLKSIEKFEQLKMSYMILTNGRITLTGEFFIEPTKECQMKTVRTIHSEKQNPLICLFNGTLSIDITKDMMPYSTLIVYTFQPTYDFNIVQSYRFSVAGLFQNSLKLNANTVPFTPTETFIQPPNYMHMNDINNSKPIEISKNAQDKTRIELTLTGQPDSIVGLNVFEYDGVLEGLTNEITKERLLKYLTKYEKVPIFNMPRMPIVSQTMMNQQTKQGGGLGQNSGMHYDRRTISEHDEEEQINRERMGYQVRYPIEEMIFGVSSSQSLPTTEDNDIYTIPNMKNLYGRSYNSYSSHYRRKLEKSTSQDDINIGQNGYVVATSMPISFTMNSSSTKMLNKLQINEQEEIWHEPSLEYGTISWYKKFNENLKNYSPEAYTFMHSGLTIISDYDSLRIPQNMKYENLTKLFLKFQQTMMNQQSFSIRDQARQLLEEYILQTDASIMPPLIMLDEQTRNTYYRSIFFNTTYIESEGNKKILLPNMNPYSTWLATAFSLNMKSGLSIAQPIHVPTSQGLYILANFPKEIQLNEHCLLTYSIKNYLEHELKNVKVHIHSSQDFDLMDQKDTKKILSNNNNDYITQIPWIKMSGVETYQMIVVPKRQGIIQIIIQVESEYGGDYEILTVHVREPVIQQKQVAVHLYDLTNTNNNYGPFIEKMNQSTTLRSVQISVSGTGLDRLIKKHTMETNLLFGIDRSLVRLYRALALRRYLNETSQMNSLLYNMTTDNITQAYQTLQLYNHYDGSYSFISDEGIQHSSLYLTSLAFGAMISPMMPFHDNVTLNRTLNWILSQQQPDGSFDDDGPCFHYRYCTGKFRRESLTAIVLYSLTRDNSSNWLPEFIYERLYNGVNSPINRAQSYLQSRVTDVKPHLLTITLFEMAFIQNKNLSSILYGRIQEALLSRKLSIVKEDGSKYLANPDPDMTFDDQLLINAMTVSLYAFYKDYKTATDIARWVVNQIELHPHYDTVLDAVFRTEAWLNVDCLFRKQYPIEKYSVTVDITTDHGEKHQVNINSKNLDLTQTFSLTLPINSIQYTMNGFGLVIIRICQTFVQEQMQQVKPIPFQLTQEFTPMPSIKQINAKTCMTYQPTADDLKIFPANFNRTIVVEIGLPSGTRIDLRQIGFMLSGIEHVMYFTYKSWGNKLIIFLNVPSAMFGKSICLEWCLERLSMIKNWSPIQVHVFDYLQQENQLVKLIPIQFPTNLIGYPYVEAVQKAKPTI